MERETTDFMIIHNQQTPVVPEISLEELLDQKPLLEDFLEHASTAYKQTGLALAANQVGIIDGDKDLERFMLPVIAKRVSREVDDWFLILKPTIIEQGGNYEEKKEYCLTWPKKLIIANRYHNITVQYFDIYGSDFIEDFSGFEAQIWQHEIAHLLGIEEKVVKSSGGMEHSKKIGRNDPCPCGSGKKHKKCCY